MGKAKRPARKHSNHHDNPKSAKNAVVRRQHSQKPPQHAKKAGSARGNGGPPALESKYPGVEKTIQYLQGVIEPGSPRRDDSADVSHGREGHEGQWEGFSPSPPASPRTPEQKPSKEGTKKTPVNILYGIDATKLSTVHKKALRPYSPFTKIVFNFPHVGGLSTDVNRQVRYNQELLVGFFKSAKGLLSSPSNPARVLEPDKEAGGDHEDDSESSQDSAQHPGAVDGQILVTLFEGEPYTLWNIRDLARHCNLKVVESFKFPWSAYPGYQHARTIGQITSGKDRSAEGKRKGAWRGEERDARCYIVADQDAETDVRSSQKKRKRGQDDEDDSD
ncbi:hypothetical protein HRR83_002082 [Exophiala dermatitidis]|uniref:25S rRNA (uridine-N(3))-methyltransferase BMT5-like domain-containing protein n=1 Tax=Exophiala dermatitidis TaxID=5970 RepID=A0AAN6EWK1_EXODE|nr:hypothetical protein HRR74_002159 [Exophiala dermatitidis]KAJ4555310.1 hypothetical protein HRR77_001246 [Exophiala dermatitidis]KAJ4578900.1 hypothetical protein HRR81_003050 [Exophiala dermatitidis]KAJ4586272.1 hypothetical protein HRR82_001901 [Exophiala dermatitidis]KAJ4603028.1 hypothetical protein HRR83_002082 [Exophiala dermatitidis]